MKRISSILLVLLLLLAALHPIAAMAQGEGNIDHGGGGMGSGTSQNFWNPGNEAVRVTVVRARDHVVVTTPIDITNRQPSNIQAHFGKVSKMSYTTGRSLSPSTQRYTYVNPGKALPRIIRTSGGGNSNIEAIKSYFTDELVIRYIADVTGFSYNALINGDYKILLEPVAYMTFQGVRMAMTATEAALYDEQLGGGLRSRMSSLSHQNLPLAMFLETPDLGYPAWSGSTTTRASNANIKAALGLGIVRFGDPEPPQVSSHDYTYRVNTQVITAVTVSGGRADPDRPVTVRFTIGGQTYTVNNVYFPEGESQLVWVRWTTPSTRRTMNIQVAATGGGMASQRTITANIVDLAGNDPPNPDADDRNNAYTRPSLPSNAQKTSASWGVWRPWWQAYWVWHGSSSNGYWCDHGWWAFSYDTYRADLTASMSITPDDRAPTAAGKTMKSGYGINQTVLANVGTNQSSAVTAPQTALTYFPEFRYQSYWRLLERTSGSRFEFARNRYSTYNRRSHFTPIWLPNGSYTPYTYLQDCWTPAGMLSLNLHDSVNISGSLWDDWHISPVTP